MVGKVTRQSQQETDPAKVPNFFISTTWNSKQPGFLWLFQLDDSQSLRKKWLVHQASIKND